MVASCCSSSIIAENLSEMPETNTSANLFANQWAYHVTSTTRKHVKNSSRESMYSKEADTMTNL